MLDKSSMSGSPGKGMYGQYAECARQRRRRAILLVYVDDMLLLDETEQVKAVANAAKSQWDCKPGTLG